MKKYVIIVAGGKGIRMGTEIPKQFLAINGKAVLMHTIEAFIEYDPNISVILVLPADYSFYWKNLCVFYHFKIPHTIVLGGDERYYSVKNALEHIPDNALVAVHDGVRPLVQKDIIKNAFETAESKLTAIPVISLDESIRQKQKDGSISLDRSEYRLVQTPQCFHAELLKKAYTAKYSKDYTDDASIVEKNTSTQITLIGGNKENIKITTPFDLLLAELILKGKPIC